MDAYEGYLTRLVNDAKLRGRMAKASLARSRAYSWDVINGGLLACYHEVLAASV